MLLVELKTIIIDRNYFCKRITEDDQKNHWEVKAAIFTRSILIMFSSAVKVQNYWKSLQMHETFPSNFRNDVIWLDLRAQRKLFKTLPAQSVKKIRNFNDMMRTH